MERNRQQIDPVMVHLESLSTEDLLSIQEALLVTHINRDLERVEEALAKRKI
jgi:hypothetical protein